METRESRRKAREQRQLAYLLKQKERPKRKYYLWYLFFMLLLVYIIDEIVTNLPTNLLPEIATSLNGGDTSVFYTMSAVAIAMMVISVFYKPLADKWGRKPFLVINTLGMALALFVCLSARSNSVWLYFIGFFLLRFFVTPDEQVVYIFECSPQDKRATVYSIIKGISEFGLVLIPLLRHWIMGGEIFGTGAIAESNIENWRYVFLIPAIIAAVIAFIALLLARETDTFLDERIAYLQKSDEERAEEKKEKSKAQGGLINALKVIFTNKQLFFIVLVTFIYILGRFLTESYADIITQYLQGTGLTEGQASTKLTEILFYFPLSCAVLTLAYGFLSDKIGRKITTVILLAITAAAYGGFACGLINGWPAWSLGLFIGLFLGAFWSTGDTVIMMAGESSPTNLRASIMSAQSAFYGIGMGLSLVIGGVLTKIVPDAGRIVWILMIFAIPVYVIASIIMMIFVKETKGVDPDNAFVENEKKQ